MIYEKIKNNITSPRSIYKTKDDSLARLILYIGFLVFLLLIPVIIDLLSTKGLDNDFKSMLKTELRHQLDVDCEIDQRLICEDTSFVNEARFNSFDIVIDPGSNYIPNNLTTKIVLKEENVSILFMKREVQSFTYTDLPSEWQGLEFDVYNDQFWDSLFGGIDSLLIKYRALWIVTTLLAYTFIFILMILFEALLDTFIINLFKYGRLKFRETFRIVVNSMTTYVIIRVILDLYGIELTGIILSLLQMIPLIYALIALRNAYRE